MGCDSSEVYLGPGGCVSYPTNGEVKYTLVNEGEQKARETGVISGRYKDTPISSLKGIRYGDDIPNQPVRKFDTGATRDTDSNKLKYYGFFSPAVLKRRAEYMNEHRHQSDGTLRDPDNWKRGIPQSVYVDSLVRHVEEFKQITSGEIKGNHEQKYIEDIVCAIMFNCEGWLYEELKKREFDTNPKG